MKASELREVLVAAIADVRAGTLKAADAKAIAALAGQVNLSLQVELNIRAAAFDRKIDAAMGALEVSTDAESAAPTPPIPPAPPNLWPAGLAAPLLMPDGEPV